MIHLQLCYSSPLIDLQLCYVVVQVFRLVTEHTVEERIIERAMQKLKLDHVSTASSSPSLMHQLLAVARCCCTLLGRSLFRRSIPLLLAAARCRSLFRRPAQP